MKTHSLTLVLACLLGGVAVVSMPTGLTAQLAAQCTMKCKCYSDGCGCQRKGGNGASCDASGDGCYVGACEEVLAQTLQFGPDGTVAGHKADGTVESYREPVSDLPVAWVALPSGISLARTCGGAVAGRYVPAAVALELRARSKRLSSTDPVATRLSTAAEPVAS